MYYKTNDINLYYEIYGEKNLKEVLILPGWGDTRKTFYNLINHLKNEYKIYIIDYPGFGNSPFPNKDLNIYDYANTINSFIRDKNIKKPSIISHSFGGRISIILAGLYKIKLNKLILIDVAGIRRKSIKRYLKQKIYKIRKKLVIFKRKKNKLKYLNNLRKSYSSADYNNLQKGMYSTFKNIINEDLRKYLKNIETETLILWGNNDTSTPISDGYLINRKIKNSYLIIFPFGTHYVYLEYSNEIISIIKSYLK